MGYIFLFWVYFIFFQHFEIAFISIHPFGGYGGPKKDQVLLAPLGLLVPLPSDVACQLDIFRHNCDPLCVDGSQVGVLKETN